MNNMTTQNIKTTSAHATTDLDFVYRISTLLSRVWGSNEKYAGMRFFQFLDYFKYWVIEKGYSANDDFFYATNSKIESWLKEFAMEEVK